MMQVSRRGLLTGLATLIAAPTIVRVASIMQVRSLPIHWSTIPQDIAALLTARIEAAERQIVQNLAAKVYGWGDPEPMGLSELVRQFPDVAPESWSQQFAWQKKSTIVRIS